MYFKYQLIKNYIHALFFLCFGSKYIGREWELKNDNYGKESITVQSAEILIAVGIFWYVGKNVRHMFDDVTVLIISIGIVINNILLITLNFSIFC